MSILLHVVYIIYILWPVNINLISIQETSEIHHNIWNKMLIYELGTNRYINVYILF